ncbi:MAG: ATP synthase F1 subunit epsilon [Candidatus Marinimicrobia bacterium]|nr:ATP synthase F1 subunit epsilon [Candidatus Neomarinimicrobiota bacterium]
MSKTFQLDIITPAKVISVGEVEYLRAPSTEGLFGVQAGHAPATITMGIGEIKVTQNGKDLFYATNGGFADINTEGVLLLVETVEDANTIDTERASESSERAKSFLKNTSNDLERAQAALNRAKNRLKVAEKI